MLFFILKFIRIKLKNEVYSDSNLNQNAVSRLYALKEVFAYKPLSKSNKF